MGRQERISKVLLVDLTAELAFFPTPNKIPVTMLPGESNQLCKFKCHSNFMLFPSTLLAHGMKVALSVNVYYWPGGRPTNLCATDFCPFPFLLLRDSSQEVKHCPCCCWGKDVLGWWCNITLMMVVLASKASP